MRKIGKYWVVETPRGIEGFKRKSEAQEREHEISFGRKSRKKTRKKKHTRWESRPSKSYLARVGYGKPAAHPVYKSQEPSYYPAGTNSYYVTYDLPDGRGAQPFLFATSRQGAIATVRREYPGATNIVIHSERKVA